MLFLFPVCFCFCFGLFVINKVAMNIPAKKKWMRELGLIGLLFSLSQLTSVLQLL